MCIRDRFWVVAKRVLAHWKDLLLHRRGMRLVNGNALVAALAASAFEAGVEIRTRCPARKLLRDGERVTGAVLATPDGGRNWTLQLDGHRANDLLVRQLEQRAQAQPQAAELKTLLDDARRYKEQGADKPFLDVWFADEKVGWIVGAYNLIFRTTDGGQHWEPWFDRTDNPKLLNLHAVAQVGDGLYVVGESGLVLRLDAASQRFVARPTPYKGSFFGVVGTRSTVLVYGLRGNAYVSESGGAAWQKVEAGLPVTIVAATALPDGRLALADASGRVAISNAEGRDFKPVALKPAMPLAGMADAGGGKLALVGPRGVAVTALPPN